MVLGITGYRTFVRVLTKEEDKPQKLKMGC